MALTVTSNFKDIEINIPAATGNKLVTLTVPPLDCFPPAQVAALNKQVEENEELRGNGHEVLRLMLRFFNASKAAKDAINALVARQLEEIDKYWQEESGMTVGES